MRLGGEGCGRARRCAGLLVLCMAVGLLAGCGKDDLAAHLHKGEDMLRDGQFEEAQLEGLYVLLRDPENEGALKLVAYSLLEQNRDGEAQGYFRTLAGLSPAYAAEAAAVYSRRAQEDYEAGERNRAALRWRTALEFDSALDLGPHAFFMASRAYEDREFDLATELYGRALASYGDSSAVRSALFPYGVSLHRLERWEEASAVLDRFLRSYPRARERHEAVWRYQEVLIEQARLARARMDYEEAVRLLRQALRFEGNPPKTAEALLEMGAAQESLQNYSAAAECYRQIVAGNTAGTGRLYDTAIERLDKLAKARLQ